MDPFFSDDRNKPRPAYLVTKQPEGTPEKTLREIFLSYAVPDTARFLSVLSALWKY